jgi:membrane protein implicated in regulation of membrane protease activity
VGAVILLASLVAAWLATPGPAMTGGLSGLAGWHVSVLAVFLTPIAVGGWLLWRDSRRRSSAEPMPTHEPARTA